MDKLWWKVGIVVCAIIIALAVWESYSPSEGSKNYERNTNLIEVPNHENLYYDRWTKNVFFIFNEASGYQGYGYMAPYTAPNGLPYLWDEKDRMLVENWSILDALMERISERLEKVEDEVIVEDNIG